MLLLFFTSESQAELENDGLFSKSFTLGNETLELFGVGKRVFNKFFITKHIYTSALYTKGQIFDKQNFYKSSQSKVIKMSYTFAFSIKDSRKAWKKIIKENCFDFCEKINEPLLKFLKSVKPSEVGTKQTFIFKSDSLKVYHEEELVFTTDDNLFSQALIGNWIGLSPSGEELKQGLLKL